MRRELLVAHEKLGQFSLLTALRPEGSTSTLDGGDYTVPWNNAKRETEITSSVY
jgi:hypothetical protein